MTEIQLPSDSDGENKYGYELWDLINSLKLLSGRYAAKELTAPFEVSNDRGIGEIFSDAVERFSYQPGDIGVFVGAGGLASWLPELNLQAAVMIDISKGVLDFNEELMALIRQSESPQQVLGGIGQLQPAQYGTRDIHQILGSEAENYGLLHWTNKNRFQTAKAGLTKIPVVYLQADLLNPEFAASFGNILDAYCHKISFANFTNVHAYTKGNVDFVSAWPFSENPAIVYSRFSSPIGGHTKHLHFNLANSSREYQATISN